jgi:DNA-directed RNA polymerase specialized sigma24 family protein
VTADHQQWLTERFEQHRSRLRAMAYRMLGSMSDADDALQEAWVRLSRSDPDGIDNMGGFLTTVVANVCLNLLRARRARRDQPHGGAPTRPDREPRRQGWSRRRGGPGRLRRVRSVGATGPADAAGTARVRAPRPVRRPYDEIATILGRSPAAARQHASRARRRVQASGPLPDTDLASQRRVVDAFLAATRNGDLEALMAVLDPDVTLRGDIGGRRQASREVRGAANVSQHAVAYSPHPRQLVTPVLVNGIAGLLTTQHGRPVSLLAFTVRGGKITQIDVLADPDRLRQLDLAALAR